MRLRVTIEIDMPLGTSRTAFNATIKEMVNNGAPIGGEIVYLATEEIGSTQVQVKGRR